jgi:hypothetical protein
LLSFQDQELLQQAVREAYIHTKLAEHVGEPWARLDLAGCELCLDHDYEAQLEQASISRIGLNLLALPSLPLLALQSRTDMERQMGSDAVRRLLTQLGSEWLHLKLLRQKYVQLGAAFHEAPNQQVGYVSLVLDKCKQVPTRLMFCLQLQRAGEACTAFNNAHLPRGILKHKSMLSTIQNAQLETDMAAAQDAFNGEGKPPPQQQRHNGALDARGAASATLQVWESSGLTACPPEKVGSEARLGDMTAYSDEPVPFPLLVPGPKPSRGAKILGQCSPAMAGTVQLGGVPSKHDQKVAALAFASRGTSLQPPGAQMSRGKRLLAAARLQRSLTSCSSSNL